MAKFESIPDLIESYKSRFLPEKSDGVDTVVQLKFTDDPEASFYVMIKESQIAISSGVHGTPELTVHTTVEDWLKLNNGKSNPMMMMMQGKLKVEGPLEMAARFQSMFKPGSH